jgi:hypothetical protein
MSETPDAIKQLLSDLMETVWDQDMTIEQEFGAGDWATPELDALQTRVDAILGDWKP